ncbi:unnamed protein product [Phytophthora fragariaefolia]|uniref:Unnamed protein product n=1 Tax=Phytophthora fragariaefolia TaxID=1490495 RepID=A0A9W6Y697_9STRA|nr:unnamed protein product [Phytophthora fragariaefolia]
MNTKTFREYLHEPRAICSDWMGIDGTWKVTQLFPHLQEIVRKIPEHFAGRRASTSVKSTADEGTSAVESAILEDVAEYTSLQSAECPTSARKEEALV